MLVESCYECGTTLFFNARDPVEGRRRELIPTRDRKNGKGGHVICNECTKQHHFVSARRRSAVILDSPYGPVDPQHSRPL